MSKTTLEQHKWNKGTPRVLDDFEAGLRGPPRAASGRRGQIGRAEIARALVEFRAAGRLVRRLPEQLASVLLTASDAEALDWLWMPEPERKRRRAAPSLCGQEFGGVRVLAATYHYSGQLHYMVRYAACGHERSLSEYWVRHAGTAGAAPRCLQCKSKG